jgi:DNA-directed RNA polymerase specialized sigma24 family protein
LPKTAELELAQLLEAYQLRDPYLSEAFDQAARPVLRRMAKKRCRGLPADAVEDVVQEVFLALANPSTVRYNPARGTAIHYLSGRLMNAVKTMQVGHGLRRYGSDFNTEAQREFVSLDDLELSGVSGISLAAINARQVVHRIFADVPVGLEQACRRVWAEGEPQATVALDLGMSRFALGRKLALVKLLALPFAAAF